MKRKSKEWSPAFGWVLGVLLAAVVIYVSYSFLTHQADMSENLGDSEDAEHCTDKNLPKFPREIAAPLACLCGIVACFLCVLVTYVGPSEMTFPSTAKFSAGTQWEVVQDTQGNKQVLMFT